MKKIIISMSILILVGIGGFYTYHKMTSEKFYSEYINFKDIPKTIANKDRAIIFVIQDGCPYCKMVEPIINNYSRKNKDIVFTIVANRDKEYSNQSVKYNIKGTPTVIFYRDGKEIYRSTNAFTESEFKKTIEMVDF